MNKMTQVETALATVALAGEAWIDSDLAFVLVQMRKVRIVAKGDTGTTLVALIK